MKYFAGRSFSEMWNFNFKITKNGSSVPWPFKFLVKIKTLLQHDNLIVADMWPTAKLWSVIWIGISLLIIKKCKNVQSVWLWNNFESIPNLTFIQIHTCSIFWKKIFSTVLMY